MFDIAPLPPPVDVKHPKLEFDPLVESPGFEFGPPEPPPPTTVA